MDIKKDYYKILGVKENCNEKDIKNAYKKLALEWHPDKSKHDDAMKVFKEINEAYRALHNKKRRKIYDTYRKEYKMEYGIKSDTPIKKKYQSKKKPKPKQSTFFTNASNNYSNYSSNNFDNSYEMPMNENNIMNMVNDILEKHGLGPAFGSGKEKSVDEYLEDMTDQLVDVEKQINSQNTTNKTIREFVKDGKTYKETRETTENGAEIITLVKPDGSIERTINNPTRFSINTINF